MKKVIIIIVVVLVLVVAGLCTYFVIDSKANDNSVKTDARVDNDSVSNNKVLVVYFSAQGHTESVAKKIADNLNADIFEIVPKDEYTSSDLDWTDSNSRVSKEHDDESLRNVELSNAKVDNFDKYDTVLIGYPIWWGIAAWPVNSFVKANDFNGKTVIPFCTSSSSNIGDSGKLLEDEANGGTWMNGQRFSSSVSDSDIKTFTDSLTK